MRELSVSWVNPKSIDCVWFSATPCTRARSYNRVRIVGIDSASERTWTIAPHLVSKIVPLVASHRKRIV